ncbi:TPA: minor capsid protein [Streptococcus suis]
MDNLKYWEKRKAQRMVQAMEQAEQTAKQLDEIHKLASKHITSKIDQIFESYRRDHGLTEDEAARVLANVKNLSDIRELKLALQNTTDSEEIRQLLILLDSAPYASRIERYEALQREVDNLSARLYKAENGASRVFYDEFIPDAYYHSIFDLQQQSGMAFAFNRIDLEEIRTIQQTPWLGANYSERIWGNTQTLANELQKQLAVSLLIGRSAHETAEVINAQFGKGSYNSRRLVRTEASYFHAEMEAKAYEEAEVERYRLVAVLDLRTSSVCREHDGEVYLVSERVKGKNYPPLHPWCRTVTIALDDEEWLAKATRSARDPVTGKTIQVPGNMTYKDWYAKYVEKNTDLVENSAQKLYNQGMKNSGAIYGAWNAKNDPDEIHRKKHAEQYYESVRNRSTVREVTRIAKHTGFAERDVQAIYDHVFENYYELEGGSKRFDPDYDMAQSWDRLFSGKGIQKHDITLLHHELMESKLMAEGMDYDTAHKITQKKYDYLSELIKWQIERGDL